MNDTLTLYREQLRDAIDRDVRRRQTVGRRRLAIAAPAAAATATAAALLVSTGSPSGTSAADAAILRGVAAELAPPAGTILHERAMVSVQGAPAVPYELWQQADNPQSYRIIKFGHDGEYDGASGRFLLYNPGSNTITSGSVTARPGSNGRGAEDLAGTLRALVQAGNATVDATTTYDGIRAYKLTVKGSADRFLNGTAYVDASTYRPLEIDVAGSDEVIKFTAYEYLPANAGNMRLLDVSAAHPGARVVSAQP
ncbi:MAG TPA: hypothetical protein VG410_05925 [Solirubrobacteraceae bacterium]|jgi:hypothetical protein|nr:hypothetical protein [Solirubrobacteraceae bacterium]